MENETVNETVNEIVNEITVLKGKQRQVEILRIISENPEITYEELSQKLKVVRATVGRDIARLIEAGKLRRHGADKNGRWEVLKI